MVIATNSNWMLSMPINIYFKTNFHHTYLKKFDVNKTLYCANTFVNQSFNEHSRDIWDKIKNCRHLASGFAQTDLIGMGGC